MPSANCPFPPHEPFTEDEMAEAHRLRRFVTPAPFLKRRDSCPHAEACPNVRTCVEYIAWYLRHRTEIEASL